MTAFSATALETYQACPQKFHYQYVERLFTPNRSEHLTVGKLFHESLDQLVKRHCPLTHSSQVLTRASELLKAKVEDLKAVGLDPYYITQLVLDLLTEQVTIEGRWQLETQSIPCASEVSQTFSLGSHTFEMRIDRIDRTPHGYVFIDYKTQATPPSWKALYQYDYLQPWLYTLYGLKTYGEQFLGFVYFLPKLRMIRPVIALTHPWHTHMQQFLSMKRHLLSPEESIERLSQVEIHLQSVIQRIEAQDFSVSKPPLVQCRTCAYKPFCPVVLTYDT